MNSATARTDLGRLFLPDRLYSAPYFWMPSAPAVQVFFTDPEPCESCGTPTLPGLDTETGRPEPWEHDYEDGGHLIGPEHTPARCRAARN